MLVKCSFWWVGCSRVSVWPVAHMDWHRPPLICSHISGRPAGFPSCCYYFPWVHAVESSNILPLLSEEGSRWAGFAARFVCLWLRTVSWFCQQTLSEKVWRENPRLLLVEERIRLLVGHRSTRRMSLLSLGRRPSGQAGVGQDSILQFKRSIKATAAAEIVSDES